MPSDSDTTQIASGVASNLWWARSRVWTNTPNFRNVPKVDLPINTYVKSTHSGEQYPWTYSKTDLTTGTTTVVYTGVPWNYNKTFVDRHNDMQGANFPIDPDWYAQENDALLKALVRISDQKLNLSVALAEATKTSNLIYDTARRIDRSIRAFRRGNFREVARQLNISPRNVHKTWLEYKYGWMPLLMDVKGAAEFFAQKSLPQRQVMEAIGIVEGTRKGQTINPGSLYYDRLWPITETWEGKVRTKVKLRVEVTSPHAAQAQQLGLTNPALYLWEVMPYSFVFDWFISVGDWLTAQTALVGLTLKTALASHEEHTFYSWDQPAINPVEAGSTIHRYGRRYGWNSRIQYWRRPISVTPISIRPTVNTSLSFQKMITSLALLRAASPRGGIKDPPTFRR